MTWHMGAYRTMVMGVVSAWCIAGCGSSGGKRAAIELLAPEDMAELTIEDDIDPETAGVQVEFRVRTQNIRSGTIMLLVMPGENTTSFASVDDEQLVVFEKVTLPPGAHRFHIQNATGSVSSKQYSYTLKTLVIETPRDGANIAFGDDSDPERDGLQVNVTVKAYAIDGDEDIELLVDGEQVGDPVRPNSSGSAVFRGITLATGVHKLKAVAGNVESSETTVDVNEACASVSYVSPAPGNGDRVTLGGGNACPQEGEDFAIDVVISTDAGEGREVELTVNNTIKQVVKVQGSLARFEDVVLNRRMSANELSVTVQGAEGVTCAPVPFPKDIYVDCAGSDCSIGTPVPFSGQDAEGEPAFYLNGSMLNGDGFDIRVDSDIGVIDQEIELIIDGRDGRNALREPTRPNANRISATFSSVDLPPGAHTIEARCTDASGNVTESGEVRWVVDVAGCGVQITTPADDSPILPSDDRDADADNGIQIELEASIDGDDCVEARAAVCDLEEGISGASFGATEGSQLTESVTLETVAEQRLCVEVRDRADNRVLESVGVKYRTEAPEVEIESPADSTVFNVQGNEGRSMDSDPATPVCNADFSVLCSELGAAVTLHRGDESGAMLASATCDEPSAADPELPAGFSGRANFDNVAFLLPADDSTMITAAQTLQGLGDQSLSGSTTISLSGRCEPPGLSLIPGCPAEQIELPGGGGDVVIAALQSRYTGAIESRAPTQAVLSVTDSTGAEISPPQTADFANGGYRFTNINLGDEERAVETTISLTDTYDNTTELTCSTMIVSDLPVLTVVSPSDEAVLWPADGCDPGVADKFGVLASLTLDQATDRELGYRVNDGALQTVTITGASMDVCVPVNDGANTIALQLDSTTSAGVSNPAIDVVANALEIIEPVANAALLDADDFCDPGFGAHVVAEVATAFEGSAVTVSAGSNSATATVGGGLIDTCLTLPPGRSTITVSLDGKSISRSVDVSVVFGAPTNPVTLTGVTLPDDANYRTGQSMLHWSNPTEDYPDQLTGYELRCASTALAESATEQEKNDWWNAAREIALPGGVAPPETSAAVGIRIGETLQCVLRGSDAADQLTPISSSVEVGYPFREHKVDVSELNRMGYALAAVGDVNGDDIDDILVGGSGRAYLYFGDANGLAAKANPHNPDVTFIGASVVPDNDFGTRVAALGDINGDGEADFAIGDSTYSPTGLNQTGAVHLFYGRKQGDSWEPVVNLNLADANACAADVCFVGELANEFVGRGLSAAGDFNGDGRGDIAIGATGRQVSGVSVGRLYVLLGSAFEGTGNTRPGKFWNINVRLPGGAPLGFYVDGTGWTGTETSSSSNMGFAIAPVGNVDGVAGADLLVTALGRLSAPSINSKLYFLSGRAHNGAAPNLRAIASSALVLKDSGSSSAFASRLASFRNWYDDTDNGVADVAVFQTNLGRFYMYLGDESGSGERFSNATRITVVGPAGQGFGNGGLAMSRGYNPNFGSVSRSDLDADGLDDLCVGTASGPGGTGAGPIYVFYGSSVAENLSSNELGFAAAAQIALSARPGATARTVQPVRDLTGDGVFDLVVGEPNANSNSGGITILY